MQVISKIISDSLSSCPYNIKNSIEFKEKIENIKIPNNHNMVSLDVTSLFTNIPLELVLKSIESRWNHIKKNRKIPFDKFKGGISFLMNNIFFKFDTKFYQQTRGMPMGSPISAILSEIVMQDLESKIFNKINFEIPIYVRYVDDSFLIIPAMKIDLIVLLFNSYHNRLQFTIEKEENSIGFLNLEVIRSENNVIITNWFRKKLMQEDI